jgi:hypothetical protein
MKRLLLIGFAACAFALAPTLSASAMPGANPKVLTDTDDSSIVLVKGGHGHGWGHHGGRGHHYGWGRGRGLAASPVVTFKKPLQVVRGGDRPHPR